MWKKQLILAALCLAVTSGVAWAGKEAYTLVMNQEKEVCMAMLKLFNADKKRGGIVFEEHKDFIQWERIEVKSEPRDTYCYQVLKARFDIDNNGTDDLVIRTRHCYKSQLTDQLYIFPSASTADELLQDANSQALDMTQNKIETDGYYLRQGPKNKKVDPAKALGWIGYGALVLEPFKQKDKYYVALSDLSQEWIAIARYLGKEDLEDVCYFHGKALPVN